MSLYRCAECQHGRNLSAWGNASVYGPLDEKGDISYIEWEEVYNVHLDSIQCRKHPDPILEKKINGQWCRWWTCPLCQERDEDRKHCPEEGVEPFPPDTSHRPRRVHGTWWPNRRAWPRSTVNRNGHVFTPGMRGTCRHCGTHVTSLAAEELLCEGDRHQCPVVVPEGATATAQQPYKSQDWLCFQPGAMNDDFTAWTCGAGHVITRAHVPPRDLYVDAGRQHEKVCAWPSKCPWEHLIEGAEV
jgi:hypothetical protein